MLVAVVKIAPPVSGADKATMLKALGVESMGMGVPLLAALFVLLAEARPEDLESLERVAVYRQHLRVLQYRATPTVNRLLERAIDILDS